MPDSPSPYRYAFTEPLHLVWLVVWLVAAIVADQHSIALGAGAAVEALYLGMFARSSAYRRRVRLKAVEEAEARRRKDRATRAATLRKGERKRYRRVQKLHQEVVGLLKTFGDRAEVPLEVDRETLDDILEGALDFCLALQTIRETLDKSPVASLKKQLSRWDGGGDPGSGDQARAQARDLLAQRIERLEELASQADLLRAQLDTIEQTLHLVKEQLPTMDVKTRLDVDVRALVSSVETTRRTVRELGAAQARDLARVPR